MVVTYAPTEGTSDGIISSEILRAKCDARRNNPSTQESRGALLGRPDSHSLNLQQTTPCLHSRKKYCSPSQRVKVTTSLGTLR